jgi:hypothetical protein
MLDWGLDEKEIAKEDTPPTLIHNKRDKNRA